TDNIGLILMGVGASGLLSALGHRGLAEIALAAALLHLCCHALFKGSLFLSAGSVQMATGTRDLDLLGGLMRRMPLTSAIFTVGAISISALPPMCGFVSEWFLLQSFLHGLSASTTTTSIVLPIAVGVFALTGGLTAAAFVKALGIGFLGLARSKSASEAQEVPHSMQAGAGFLALGCIGIGIAPSILLRGIENAVNLLSDNGPSRLVAHGWSVGVVGFRGILAPAFVGLLLAVFVGLVGIIRRNLHIPVLRRTEAWGCGRELQTARMEYTATSFAEPLQRVFDNVLRPDLDLDLSHAAESRYFVRSIEVRSQVQDALERHGYRPVFSAVRWWGDKAKWLQNGSLHRYLTYGLIALVVILVSVS
ncbi:MAG TPA: proton-conducting transporter membrane subunit, partial [Acidimicrobiales bacterium]|nr:proton-conducting transporter membrane subunit [Acidimicrobiales bacterium]